MSTNIQTAFSRQFMPGVRLLAQQKMSRLFRAVDVEMLSSADRASFDQIGATAMVALTTRHADTPQVDTTHARRWVMPNPFVWADFIDHPDKLRAVNGELMTSKYQQNAAMAAGRKIDDVIIAAFFADAITGETGTGTAAFDTATYQVPAAATGLTIAKLLSTKEILDSAENDPDDPRFFACSAKQITNLLNTTEIKSSDYNTVKALAAGQINSFCGFEFIRTQRLAASGANRRCAAWSKNSMLMGMNENIVTRVSERPDKNYLNQVYARIDLGATRNDETGVVEILCAE